VLGRKIESIKPQKSQMRNSFSVQRREIYKKILFYIFLSTRVQKNLFARAMRIREVVGNASSKGTRFNTVVRKDLF
jgi:hypothetical protein